MTHSLPSPCRVTQLILALDGPYDWELLCEQVEHYARQRGQIHVAVGRLECRVQACAAHDARSCAHCDRELTRVRYVRDDADLCAHCFRNDCAGGGARPQGLAARVYGAMPAFGLGTRAA